jgi:hypothetical protein
MPYDDDEHFNFYFISLLLRAKRLSVSVEFHSGLLQHKNIAKSSRFGAAITEPEWFL